MMTEGFAEYISLEAAKHVIADSIYEKKINKIIAGLKDFKQIVLAKIKSNADYNDSELYVYYYAPIVFTAIEKEIDKQKMWLWL